MSEQLNLAQRIATAASEVGGKLSADKRNKEGGYDYISSDKMLSVVGQALADNCIVVFPSVVEHEMSTGTTNSGKSRYDVRVKFEMVVSDGVSTMTMPWFGVGADYGAPDKATYKAITSGHKYFLAKLFCIGVGNEDGEHDAEQPQQQQTQKQPVAAKQEVTLHPSAKISIKEGSKKTLHSVGVKLYGETWEAKRHELVAAITDGRTNSSNELYEDEAQKLIAGISQKLQNDKAA